MAAKANETNWMAAGLVFAGCMIVSIAIGQIVDDASWAAIGVGTGIVLVGVFHYLSSNK